MTGNIGIQDNSKEIRNEIKMEYYNIEETVHACWLASFLNLGRKKARDVVKVAGSYKDAYHLSEKQIQSLLGEKDSEKWQQYKKKISPQMAFETIERKGIGFTYYEAPDFPQKLMCIPDAPLGIFYLGKLPQPDIPSVAMIGARKYSDYGRCMAEYFADRLARAGITIISGMALGIDGISQRTALKAGGLSYGILGCGVDVVYPPGNKGLYEQLIEKGGVLSEYPPGTEPRAMLFPQRNRIISALSDVVLVVEAREKSGTLITVDMALEQGKEVYAIPGRCTDGLSMGCNRLLRQGAGIAVTPEELIEDLGWNHNPGEREVRTALRYEMSEIAGRIYQVLDISPSTQDDIIMSIRKQKDNCTVPEICRGLLELEMKQIVSRTGGQYRLTNPKI